MTGPLVAAALVVAAVLVTPAREAPAERRWARRRGVERPGAEPAGDPTPPRPADVARSLVLLALTYRSGLPTWQVLREVALRAGGAVERDLRQVAAALEWGAGEAEAWGSVGAVWAPAARAVAVATAAGVAPGPLLLAASGDLRARELERVEVAAARVGVRLVAPVGLVLLPAFCLTTVVPLVLGLGRGLLAGQ